MSIRIAKQAWMLFILSIILGFSEGKTPEGISASWSEKENGFVTAEFPKDTMEQSNCTEIRYVEDAEGMKLLSEQEELLISYMEVYYQSLASLEIQDFGTLFSNPEQELLAERTLFFHISMRKMQKADYSLVSYRYMLKCENIKEQEDGTLRVFVGEDNVQNFRQTPEVDSQRFGAYHRFVLEEKDGTWYIQSHMLFDGLYMVLYQGDIEQDLTDAYMAYLPEYLELIREEVKYRESQREWEPVMLEADHGYDREAAVAYADSYIEVQNEEWPYYGGRGGNCQNYASQCLIAGGIPMDIYGTSVWKWYSESMSNGPGAQGRSSSWTGVDQFVHYVKNNSGYGLVAETEAPYYTGEAGDLLHMGTEGDWRHTVVIASRIEDESGEVLDYLMDSNTGDLRNYPASLYGYPKIILTKIFGWNE